MKQHQQYYRYLFTRSNPHEKEYYRVGATISRHVYNSLHKSPVALAATIQHYDLDSNMEYHIYIVNGNSFQIVNRVKLCHGE